ncbi:MAG: hypothetical protein G01um101470_172 [Parcubacteria group bacterium Gr01-1014_70]|nr:MAG: hypothetical protein G01um101470_172 [Parcubacteria group bacterium Gr01-1014_70]
MFYTVVLVVLMFMLTGCSGALLQSRNISTPFPASSKNTCTNLRQDLFQLRSDLRAHPKETVRDRSAVLAKLSLDEHMRNAKPLSTPREKMDLLISSNLLVNMTDTWQAIEDADKLDILGIICRDVEETFSPGVGEGLFYADFHRVGENFKAYLVFLENELTMVFAPNSLPIDEYDRETILSLIGHASRSAVNQGVKAAIP